MCTNEYYHEIIGIFERTPFGRLQRIDDRRDVHKVGAGAGDEVILARRHGCTVLTSIFALS
jgi:hypothetical protein